MSLSIFEDYIENCNKHGKKTSWKGLREYRAMYNKQEEKEPQIIKSKRVIDGAIANEIAYTREYSELDFVKNNIDYKQAELMTEIIHKALIKDMKKEQRELLDELYLSINNKTVELCNFYFKKGLRAGLINLKFLNELDDINSVL